MFRDACDLTSRTKISKPQNAGVSSADLLSYLPRVVQGHLSRSLYSKRGVYLLLAPGRGTLAHPSPYTIDSYSMLASSSYFEVASPHYEPEKQVLFYHEHLSQPGCEYQIHVLSVFDPANFWLYSYVVESLSICLFDSVTSEVTSYHTPPLLR